MMYSIDIVIKKRFQGEALRIGTSRKLIFSPNDSRSLSLVSSPGTVMPLSISER
jgi:hypothetical protein